MDSLVSRMHHLIAPVSVSLHFPRGLSKRDRRERLCFEGKKSGGGKGKYELDYDAEKESLSFFFAIPANCETLASGKAVCLTRLIDFYGSKPRWKSVISYDVLPFLLITIDSYMIDLYHYVHDVICIICMIALFYTIDLLMNIIIYICLIYRVYTINLIISLARLDLFHLANRSKFILLNRGSVFHASKVVLLFLLGNKRRRNSFQRYPRFH